MTPTAAVVQAGSIPFDPGATIRKAESLVAAAAGARARIVVFPEAFVGGYPKGADFGARVGWRTPAGRALFRRYFDGAIAVPGPHTAALGDIARTHAVHLVIGVIERAGGTLYCTVLFFDPSGALLGKHRKVMPTAMERLIWGFGDGSTLPVFDTPCGRLGAAICWENYMPMLRMALYGKGVQIYCAPTVDDRDTWSVTMRHIALEGRCFVLSACQYITRAGYPEDYPAPDDLQIRGGSLIAGPLGDLLAGPVYGEETILTAELELARITEGKFDFDAAGHYARPDIFRLTVNERPAPAVEFLTPREEPENP